MKKPSIALFCEGNQPTAKEFALLKQYAHYNVVAYNVANLSETDVLVMDGVCGAIPAKYKHLPNAKEIVAQYEKYLSTLGSGVGGVAPKPRDEDKTENSENETENLDLAQNEDGSDQENTDLATDLNTGFDR